MNATPPPPGDNLPPAEWNLAAGQSIAGRYLLKRILGQGGMGVVWLAHDTRLREPVALKFLPVQVAGDAVALERLRRETLRSRKLSHPNIVRIHDFHEGAGEPAFISMEYIDGSNLHYLRAARPTRVLSWKYIAPLAMQLCEALHYAHKEGVIHRDLKPANLMLDSSGRLKLADFGLARGARESASGASKEEIAGTIAYMSPQQAAGRGPSISDDIYALGATLYELLTSEPPFHSGDVSYQIQQTRPQPLGERLLELGLTNDKIPSQVSALIMACLAKDPEQRPASAQAILEWLSEARTDTSAPTASAHNPAIVPPAPSSAPRAKTPPLAQATEDKAAVPPAPRFRFLKLMAAVAVLLAAAIAGAWWKNGQNSRKGLGGADAAGAATATAAYEYENLFNGTDLSGWSCDSRFWSIEDGTIVGHAPYIDRSAPRSTFLVWGEEVGDFELRLLFKCEANSGISYRARRNSENSMTGYHAEIFSRDTGELVFTQSRKNRAMGKAGQRTVVRPSGGGEVIDTLGPTADPTEIYNALTSADWKEYVIIARSNCFQHWINGVLFADVTDENPGKFVASGRLALEFSPRNSNGKTVRFKDIRLRRFPASTAAVDKSVQRS